MAPLLTQVDGHSQGLHAKKLERLHESVIRPEQLMKLSNSIVISLCAAALVVSSCAGNNSKRATFSGRDGSTSAELIAISRGAATASQRESNGAAASKLAKDGIDAAEKCLLSSPEEAGCYYWRAVNKGLYIEHNVIGYQKVIKEMIADCNRVISLDKGFDHGGAYRILGALYTKLPETAGRVDSITRDLDLAEKNLRSAISVASDYPENHLALAETLMEEGKIVDATAALQKSKELSPLWKSDASYDDWKRLTAKMEKRLAKEK